MTRAFSEVVFFLSLRFFVFIFFGIGCIVATVAIICQLQPRGSVQLKKISGEGKFGQFFVYGEVGRRKCIFLGNSAIRKWFFFITRFFSAA